MLHRVGEVAALAEQVRRSLADGDRHAALRWVAEFVWDVDHAHPTERTRLMADRPPSTSEQAWDAMLAGVVELLSSRHGVPIPAWTVEPERFLATWWFFSDRPAWMVSAFTEAPPALANRGVFVHAAALESV